MKCNARRPFLAIVVVLLFAATAGVAHAQQTDIQRGASKGAEISASGVCLPTKVAFRTETIQVNTSSNVFATLPGSGRSITTTAPGCVIVDFSGELLISNANNRPFLRAVRVGPPLTVAEPPDMRMGTPITLGFFQDASARFVFKSLPAGTHVIAIQWRSTVNGQFITAGNRILTIQYR